MNLRTAFFLIIAIGTSIPVGTAIAQNSTGLVFLDEDAYRSIPLATPPFRGDLPARADLSRYFPRPGNQGRQPSCVGWATGYALKTFQESQEHKWEPTDSKRQFSPAFIYNQIKLPGGGAHFIKAFDILMEQGALQVSEFPYDEKDDSTLPSSVQKQSASRFRVATWRRVNPQSKAEVKGQLSANFPVVIGAKVGDAFQSHRGSGVFQIPTGAIDGGGHAMVIIGYDDEKSAYRLINSWGDGWGDGGYAWVHYDTLARMTIEAYCVQDILSPVDSNDKKPDSPDQVPDIPDPGKLIATAQLTPPTMLHNQFVANQMGMTLGINGTIQKAKGRSTQIVIRFSFPDGRVLNANAQELTFRDATGQVAVGSQQVIGVSDNINLAGTVYFIPYYALNLVPTGGRMRYDLMSTVFVYVDGFEVKRSAPSPFSVTW